MEQLSLFRIRSSDPSAVFIWGRLPGDVTNVKIARRIKSEAVRLIELRLFCRTSVARKARFAVPRNRADGLRLRINPPHAMIAQLDEVKIARFVPCHFVRHVERGLGGRATITLITARAAARVCHNLPIGTIPPDARAIHIAEIQLAIRSARDGINIVELRLSRQPGKIGDGRALREFEHQRKQQRQTRKPRRFLFEDHAFDWSALSGIAQAELVRLLPCQRKSVGVTRSNAPDGGSDQ